MSSLNEISTDQSGNRVVVRGESLAQTSTELTRGPPELVQHFRSKGEFTSAQERCMS